MTTESRADLIRKKRRFWKHHIEGWQNSGLSQIDYCRQKNLIPHRFTYWKKKLSSANPSDLSFVPVSIAPTHLSPVSHKLSSLVVVADRYRIEVDGDFSSDTLTKLLRTLRRA